MKIKPFNHTTRSRRRTAILLAALIACTGAFTASFTAAARAAEQEGPPLAPGTLIERPQFMREGGTNVMDRSSRPYRLPDGTFITRADTYRGFDQDVNDFNSSFRAMKLDRHGKVIKSFAKTQIGRGIRLGGRTDNWQLSIFSYLGNDRVAFTTSAVAGWGARGRATIVFNAKTGRLDRNFGKEGRRIETFPESRVAFPQAAVAGPDGKLLECGSSVRTKANPNRNEFGYLRQFTATGSLDRSFGPGGVVTTRTQVPAVDSSECWVLARDPVTGEILIGGNDHRWTKTYGSDFAGSWIRRYDANGRLDTTFGRDGIFWEWKYSTPARKGGTYPRVIKVLPDRSLIVSSYFQTQESQPNHSTLFKVTPDGKLDTSFAAGGFDVRGNINVIELQADGKLLVGGWRYAAKPKRPAMLMRLLPNGEPDPTWIGNDPMAYAPFGGSVKSISIENGFARVWNFFRMNPAKWRNGAWDGTSMFRARYARIVL